MLGWYGDQHPVDLNWIKEGEPIGLGKLELPALLAIPANDRIVPTAWAQTLANAIPSAEIIRPSTGHIGMVVGRRS